MSALEPIVDWLRRLNDPLRNSTQIGRWMARLPGGDVLEIQRQALELLANFPVGGQEATAAQLEALLKLDARLEPIIRDLTRQYTLNYQKSSTVESRLWHAVFDLVKGFIGAYNAERHIGIFRVRDNKRARGRVGLNCRQFEIERFGHESPRP